MPGKLIVVRAEEVRNGTNLVVEVSNMSIDLLDINTLDRSGVEHTITHLADTNRKKGNQIYIIKLTALQQHYCKNQISILNHTAPARPFPFLPLLSSNSGKSS
jgi:hypothetical protein